MEPQGSSPYSQQPAIGPSPEIRIQSTPSELFPWDHSICLRLCLSPWSVRTKILYVFLISAMHAICPAHPIFLDLIILIIFGEEYKLNSQSEKCFQCSYEEFFQVGLQFTHSEVSKWIHYITIQYNIIQMWNDDMIWRTYFNNNKFIAHTHSNFQC
jgi:hypothetical protein